MKVLILGGTVFLGRRLVGRGRAPGDQITLCKRDHPGASRLESPGLGSDVEHVLIFARKAHSR